MAEAEVAALDLPRSTSGPEWRDGALAGEAVASVLENLRPGGALALGPGLGRSDGAVAFARALAREAKAPLVLDADGLNAHAGRLENAVECYERAISINPRLDGIKQAIHELKMKLDEG